MHYYKSQELAGLYGVNRRTVTNWVKQTQEGKLDLELGKYNGEFYIIKSRSNQNRLDNIVEERQKYLNNRSRKHLKPSQDFYKIYNEQQIYDIIQSLQLHRELPLQYSYFGEGAEIWNDFRNRPNDKFDTTFLVESNLSYLDALLEKYDKVNVVDVGVGNGMGSRDILTYLHKKGKINKYIGIDISQDMLSLAEGNINEWFNNEITCDMHVRDISHQLFGDIIAEPLNPKAHAHTTINLVLLFGGSISNFKKPGDIMRIINKSMGAEDLFLCHYKTGAKAVKNRLSFISNYQHQCSVLLGLMDIDSSFYEQEIGFDEEEKMRYGRIRLNRSLSISFDLPKGRWQVDIKKNESILTYRALFNDAFGTPKNLFYDNGFRPLLTAKTLDNTGMLVVSTIETEN